MAVGTLYDQFQRDHAANPTYVEYRVKKKEFMGLAGKITEVEGAKVQFHIVRQLIPKDEFVECAFPEESAVLELRKGQTVTLYGNLDKAFPRGLLGDVGFKDAKAIKLKNCPGPVPGPFSGRRA